MRKNHLRNNIRRRHALAGIESMTRLWSNPESEEVAHNAGTTLIAIARRNRVRIPRRIRMRICRTCKKALNSTNSKTRIKMKCVVVSCLDCGRVHRYYGGV
tara:strand:- start:2166 stop:2468 length:303 start_codon:yes stop_codon:yes gene_type:complete